MLLGEPADDGQTLLLALVRDEAHIRAQRRHLRQNEERYISIRGDGEFQVDGKIFAVGEGSVIRVSPDGRRALRNTGAEPMIMICVQYKADSFASSDADDGVILDVGVVW